MKPNRRQFLKSTSLLAGSAFAPNLLLGKDTASGQLNVAAVGCGGKGLSDITEISRGNRIAFLCDVDRNLAKGAMERFPDAKFFSDYREMFAAVADQIDVVTVSTPDHRHFPIAVEAIRRGKPVMVQKPLTNNLWECRALADFAANAGDVALMQRIANWVSARGLRLGGLALDAVHRRFGGVGFAHITDSPD